MGSRFDIKEVMEQNEQIFNGLAFGMCLVGPSLEFVKVNDALCEIVGYTRDELIGMTVADITHPDDIAADLEVASKAFAGESFAHRLERRYIRKDGEVIWVSVSASTVAGTEELPAYGLAVIDDISDRKRTEQLLTRSEEHFRAVVETAIDAIVSANSAGEITFFNKSAEQIFGYSADEVVGEPLTTIMSDRFRADDLRGMKRFLETGEASVIGKAVEVAGRRKDGSEVPIEIALSSWSANGEVMFTAILRDIADRKRAETEAEHARDEFLGVISHDLRTPLTSIRGYVELMLEGEVGAPTDEARHFLEVISRNAVRLERLVGDLLFVAQVESGEFAIESAPVDVGELVSECVEGATPAAAEKGVELTLRAQEPAAESLGDRDRLCQMLDNLISNALKYTPEGGQVEVELYSENGHVAVEVKDSGVGISVADQEHLFERFFRASSATRRRIPGVGLGLTIVKAIAEGHGGFVSAKSKEGEGSAFRVELPLPEVSGREGVEIGRKGMAL